MKKVITWVADDGEEFATEEQCYAYEHRFDGALDSVIFLDDEFNVIPWDLEKIYDNFIYLAIRDEEKAHDLFWAIREWESCFEIPKGYHTGDLLAWDGDEDEYINLRAQRDEIDSKIEAIEKAVNAV